MLHRIPRTEIASEAKEQKYSNIKNPQQKLHPSHYLLKHLSADKKHKSPGIGYLRLILSQLQSYITNMHAYVIILLMKARYPNHCVKHPWLPVEAYFRQISYNESQRCPLLSAGLN
jgi:hypothetical protein